MILTKYRLLCEPTTAQDLLNQINKITNNEPLDSIIQKIKTIGNFIMQCDIKCKYSDKKVESYDKPSKESDENLKYSDNTVKDFDETVIDFDKTVRDSDKIVINPGETVKDSVTIIKAKPRIIDVKNISNPIRVSSVSNIKNSDDELEIVYENRRPIELVQRNIRKRPSTGITPNDSKMRIIDILDSDTE